MTNEVSTRKNIRFVTVKGVKYLRAEDVAEFIIEMVAAEETDVRNRFNEVSKQLMR